MAALAPTMRVATGILLLPFLHPLEVAENIATLDALTNGRAVLGVGIGYADLEFRAFGVDRRTRVARFNESLAVIRASWSGKPIQHDGKFWTIEAPPNTVVPVQPGGPPIWVAGQTEAAVRRAARVGDAWYVPPFPTHEQLLSFRQIFLEEREANNIGPEREFPVRRELFIAPTPADALKAIGAQVQGRFETYVDWGVRQSDGVGDNFAKTTEETLASRFILGPPEHCAEQIAKLADMGATTFVLKTQWPGLSADESVRQLELFGEHVMPLVAKG
jgi:alkanesulfonate monooxygenase SsuD/methylene tetrahydromethanopterin reductase-like flavin-dependent oxidoreductase (luciferase family)